MEIFHLRTVNKNDNFIETRNLMKESGISNFNQFNKICKEFYENSVKKDPDLDKGIIYIFCNKDNKIIAASRIKQDEHYSSAASIQYIAVHKSFRGKGIGKKYLEELFKTIKHIHKKDVAILATTTTKKFYLNCGMSLLGEINHSKLTKDFLYKIL